MTAAHDQRAPARWILPVALLGVALRLSLTLTTVGTDDVRNSALWGGVALDFGLVHAYDHSPWLNHPPLGLAEMAVLRLLAAKLGILFATAFRLAQSVADLVSYTCLLALGRRTGAGEWIAAFYFLSPPAILISGFHGNSDSTMIAWVLVAAALSGRRPTSAGMALAAATGVKIVPLLLAPAFFLAARQRRWRFVAGWSAAMALLFGLPTLLGGPALLRNTLLYRGMGNWWGVVSMLLAVGRGRPWLEPLLAALRRIDPVVIVALVLAIAWWLRRELRAGNDDTRDMTLLLATCGLVFTTLLVAGTGFGVQYLLWPMPFLPLFARPALRTAVTVASSVFLVVVYTRWSGGFPWWFAISTRPGATTDAVVAGGWLVWAALLATSIAGPRWAAQASYPRPPDPEAGGVVAEAPTS